VKQFLAKLIKYLPFFRIKKDGVRLYEHARAGESIEIKVVKQPFNEFEITRIVFLKLILE
jgi:tRNA pseudouridine55 synthase